MLVDDILRIAVVGAGLMGHSIALEFALAGFDVRLQSRSQGSLDRAASRIDESLNRLVDFGKQPVVVAKEVIGFIASRLQGALLREALWLVENGVATAGDVDVTIKTSLGRRWAVAGVFEVLEIAGWDLVQQIDSILFPELASSPEVSPVMKEMAERGDLGLKSGKGFYRVDPGIGRGPEAEDLRGARSHPPVASLPVDDKVWHVE